MTLQEVETYPAGCKVLVDGVEWERVENGLMRDGSVLGLMHFAGYINEGRIKPGLIWLIGRWYRNGNSFRLCTHRVGERIHAFGWSNDRTDPEWESWPQATLPGAWRIVAETDEDPWMQRAQALWRDLSDQIPERFVERLHGYANDAGDAEFDDILDEFGIGRGREHTSSVSISGHAYWTPTLDEALNWLGEDEGWNVTDVDDSITVYWSRHVEIVNTGVGCLCGEVDRSQVQQYVPPATEDFDFEVECA